MSRFGFILFLLWSFPTIAQRFPVSPNEHDSQGKRIGHWTILYDSSWHEVHDVDSVAYYRLVRYEAGQPKGKVRDFYRNGNRQWDGELASMPPDVFSDGEGRYYHENGTLKTLMVYKGNTWHGPVKEYTNKGELSYTGTYVNGKLNGLVTNYFPTGEKRLERIFKDDLAHGPYTFYRQNGVIEQTGTRQNGLLEGEVLSYNELGRKDFQQFHVHDTIEGLFISYFPDGSVKTKGNNIHGMNDGKWIYHHSPGVLSSEGNYVNGEYDGEWLNYHENGKLKNKEWYKKGLRNGPYESYTEEGNLEEKGTYKDGMKQVKWVKYFASGKVSEDMIYKNDTLQGLHTTYHENGQIKNTGNELDGLSTGPWKFYFEDGAIKTEAEYKENSKQGEWKYYQQGNAKPDIETFEKGYLMGPSIDYYPDGKIKKSANYYYDTLHGAYISFYANGQTEKKGTFVKGKWDGQYEDYHPNGQLMSRYTVNKGLFNGKYYEYHNNGNLKTDADYKNNLYEGHVKRYSYGGKLYFDAVASKGKYNGLIVFYDSITGMKETSGIKRNDLYDGPQTFYDKNGKKTSVSYYVMGFHETVENVKDSIQRLVNVSRWEEALKLIPWLERVVKRDSKDPLDKAAAYLYKGRAYYAGGQYQLGYDNDKKYLDIVARLSPNSERHRTALNDLAVDANGLGKSEESASLYDQALEVGQKIGLNSDYWRIATNKVTMLRDWGKKDEATQYIESLVKLAKDNFGDSAQTFMVRYELADYYYRHFPTNDEALAIAKDLTNSVRKYNAFDNSQAFYAYWLTGKIEKDAGRYSSAAVYFDTASMIATKNGTTRSTDYADMLTNAYYNYDNLGDTTNVRLTALKVMGLINVVYKHKIRAGMLKIGHRYYYARDDYKNAALYSKVAIQEAEEANQTNTTFYSGLLQDFAFSELYAGGDTTKAIESFVKSVALRKTNEGAEKKDYYDAAFQLSEFYDGLKMYDKQVEVLSKEVLPSAIAAKDSLVVAQSQRNLGYTYYTIDNFQESIDNITAALQYYDKHRQDYKATVISCYGYLSYSNYSLGNYKRALENATISYDLAKEHYKEDNISLHRALERLAYTNKGLGNYSDAFKLYEELTAIYKRQYGEEDVNYLDNVAEQGKVLNALSLYKKAYTVLSPIMPTTFGAPLPLWKYTALTAMNTTLGGLGMYAEQEVCLKNIKKASLSYFGISPFYVNDIMTLSEFYYGQNRYEDAEREIHLALSFLRDNSFGKTSMASSALGKIASFYANMDKNKQAEELYLESLRVIQGDTINRASAYETAMENIASFYSSLGRYIDAELTLKKLLRFSEARYGKQFYFYKINAQLIQSLYRQDRDAESMAMLTEAMPLVEDLLGPYHWLTLDYHNYAGIIADYAGDYDVASREYQFVIDGYKRIPKPSNIEIYNTGFFELNKANVLIKQNEISKADSLINDAEKNLKKSGLFLDADIRLNIIRKKATVLEQKGNVAQANALWESAFSDMLGYIQSNFSFMSDEERAVLWKGYKPVIQEFYSFASRQAPKVTGVTGSMYNIQLATKAILLSSSNKVRKRILSSGDTTLISMFYRWQRYRNQLAQIVSMPGYSKGKVDTLRMSINHLEKELNIAGEETDKSREVRSNWRHIQSLLKANEAAVEIIKFKYSERFTRDSSVYVALVLTPETKTGPRLIPLANAKFLDGRALKFYRNAITNRINDTISYRNYWKALTPHLAGKSVVYLSLDGAYNSLNLNTLQSADSKFLIDEKSLILVSNTRDIIELKGRNLKMGKVTTASLFGYPTYFLGKENIKERVDKKKSAERDLSDIDRSGISILPGTKVEVEQVAGILQSMNVNVDTYLSENANEETVKDVHHPQILHMATHGFFFDEDANNSKLGNFSDPMLRAGLLFSGSANFLQDEIYPQKDNGVLTAYEASNLGLDRTDLVVLSACETGKGEVQTGEGVYGLQRAFQTAGAKSILMSLWKVDDEATQQLMTAFYKKWMGGQTKSEAFKQAQLELKKKYPNPYYWGAFVMMGM